MTIDDIEGKWSETVYVWVRPADGDWDGITRGNGCDRGKTEWRPAAITGFSDDGWAYGTQNDTRNVTLIGAPYGYRHALFEIGAVMTSDFDPTPTPLPAPAI